MFDLSEAEAAAALRELALEDQASVDRAVDATAERAWGRSRFEVEAMLRARLDREGLDLGDDAALIAEQIVQAVTPHLQQAPVG